MTERIKRIDVTLHNDSVQTHRSSNEEHQLDWSVLDGCLSVEVWQNVEHPEKPATKTVVCSYSRLGWKSVISIFKDE